ncbi:MAG: alpha/beta hydrolase [Opitutae bacterium]|nr:alpha/beta hydrolase [Opitutae bacterium]
MALAGLALGGRAAEPAAPTELETPAAVKPLILPLWPDGSPNNPATGPRPVVELYRPFVPAAALPAVIVICPGGGYGGLSPYERLFAEYFRSLGYTAAVVNYRVAPHRHPAPYADAVRAIRLLRQRAAELKIPARNLALMGGSAGGHLAALVATRPDFYRDPADDLAATVSARPDRLILAYPVISALPPYAHGRSFNRLLGPEASREARQEISPELHVTADMPPTFLFHAADDSEVSVENSLLFARACWAIKVPAELHVFPRGGHGRLFAYAAEVSPRWRDLLRTWLAGWKLE